MRTWIIAVLAAPLALSACSRGRFAREDRTAAREIEAAEDLNAPAQALARARRSVVFAREAEANAERDLERAQAGRAVVSRKLGEAELAEALGRARLGRVDAQIEAEDEALAIEDARAVALRAAGFGEPVIRAAIGDRRARAGCSRSELALARTTAADEVALLALEREAARAEARAVDAREEIARARLRLARSIHGEAAIEARAAARRGLEERQAALEQKRAHE